MIIYHLYEAPENHNISGAQIEQKFYPTLLECMARIREEDRRLTLFQKEIDGDDFLIKWTYSAPRHEEYQGTGQPDDTELDWTAIWYIEKKDLKLTQRSICIAFNYWPHYLEEYSDH